MGRQPSSWRTWRNVPRWSLTWCTSALNQVGVGQTFQVIYGGQTYTYRVAHTETIPLDSVNMRRALAVYGNGDGLNIMTCAGQFVPSRNTYDHRLIVYAIAV